VARSIPQSDTTARTLDAAGRGAVQPKAVAFDVDAASLISLRQAFPGCEVEAIAGATVNSLEQDWKPHTVDLLVIGAREQVAETLGLCRSLRSQAGRAYTALLVLVPPEREALVRAALDAGADSCLVLPVHAKELINTVARIQAGSQPGRHTLDLHQAQNEDRWRDDGGEA
jgi:DNA-binding response OmpR family regulator